MAERALSVCDLDPTPTVAAAQVRIDVNGEQRVLDLCEAHVEQFRSVIADFLPASPAAAARPAARGVRRAGRAAKSSGGRAAARGRTAARAGGRGAGRRRRSGPDTAAVRAWAREQGIAVSDRGRLSSDVVSRYEQAQAAGGGTAS